MSKHRNTAPTDTFGTIALEGGVVWDAIVVGGGLAGCISARELVGAGLNVLVLEAGAETAGNQTPSASLVGRLCNKLTPQRNPFRPDRWPEMMRVNLHDTDHASFERLFPAILGTGPGGSSLIYGGALTRFERQDFECDDASAVGGVANDWPVSWTEMSSHYREAEALMGVAKRCLPSTFDVDTGSSQELGAHDRELVSRLRKNGRQPYRLPVGISYVAGCDECLGVRCARSCRSDGFSNGLAPMLERPNVLLKTNARVKELRNDDDTISVHAEVHGQDSVFRARRIVMAAGALNTPRILSHSATIWNGGLINPMLGRGLMFHGLDIFAVVNDSRQRRDSAQKTLAIRDHYRDEDGPLGEIQSFALPVSTGMITNYLIEVLQRKGFGCLGPLLQLARLPAAAARSGLRHTTLFATILEDYPYVQNRLVLGEGETEIGIEYRVSDELKARGRRLRTLVRESFAPNRVVFLTLEGTVNWGHPCGTCRMGRDRTHSVVNPLGRLWADERIAVVDASTFASSAGTNPGLTVVANALRVSRSLVAELKGTVRSRGSRGNCHDPETADGVVRSSEVSDTLV